MNVTVERVENEATLKITAPAAEVNAGYKKAATKIADQQISLASVKAKLRVLSRNALWQRSCKTRSF